MKYLALAVTAAALLVPQVTQAQATCGETYEVRAGDTLSRIASEAFSDSSRWIDIYDTPGNARTIGSNPNLLKIGMTLSMPPCPGVVAGPVEIPESTTEKDPSGGFVKLIELVTGGDYAPFTDPNADGRGMLTQVVDAALKASDLPNDFRIDFVNDWSAQLKVLLPRGKYDFSFPWFKPDCSDPSKLPENNRIRCDYVWSEPLYDVAIPFYAPVARDTTPTDFADLHGSKICRPAGYFTFDLANQGLIDGETITLVQPSTVGECFNALEKGTVDYVSVNLFTAQLALAKEGNLEVIKPLDTMITSMPLRLVAHKENAEAAYKWMDAFNEGLRRIQENGLMKDIVEFHRQKYQETLAKAGQ